jgi:hypothetical protein
MKSLSTAIDMDQTLLRIGRIKMTKIEVSDRKKTLRRYNLKPKISGTANISDEPTLEDRKIAIPSLDDLSDENLDLDFYCLLADVKGDPSSYAEALRTPESGAWQKAVSEELNSINESDVWSLVDRPDKMSDGSNLNLIDFRWVFKRKPLESSKTKYKARLVIRGFKDRKSMALVKPMLPCPAYR